MHAARLDLGKALEPQENMTKRFKLIWNPHLTEIERLCLTEVVMAIGNFNRA